MSEPTLADLLDSLAAKKSQMLILLKDRNCACGVLRNKVLRGLSDILFTPTVESIDHILNGPPDGPCDYCVSVSSCSTELTDLKIAVRQKIGTVYNLTEENNPFTLYG